MKWITRERPKIDRISCPWLIKNFDDKEAEFVYVSKDKKPGCMGRVADWLGQHSDGRHFIAVVVYLYGRFIGNMAFRAPLSLTISIIAFRVWVLIILLGSYGATLYPARRANRFTTREALAYE